MGRVKAGDIYEETNRPNNLPDRRIKVVSVDGEDVYIEVIGRPGTVGRIRIDVLEDWNHKLVEEAKTH